MTTFNIHLLEFFTNNYKPGIIGLIGTKDAIGLAIREAQRNVTVDNKASLWSHCFIFGELRRDRRGSEGAMSESPYIFESDITRLNITHLIEPVGSVHEHLVNRRLGCSRVKYETEQSNEY